MTRIRVVPENLDCLAANLKQNSMRLFNMIAEINTAYFNLDWDIREKVQRSADVKNAETRARRLSEELLRLAEYLAIKAKDFERADPQSAEQLAVLSNLINQLPLKTIPPSDRYKANWKIGERWPLYKDYIPGTIHTGIDITPKNEADTSITPIGPGEVVTVGAPPSTYGHYIVIKHTLADGREVFSKYAHLQEPPNFAKGANIYGTDTVIGIMGDTGSAKGAHLHLEVTNKYPPVLLMNGKDPNVPFSPNGPSYLERMKEDYLNPEDVINGNLGWEFKVPPKE